MIFDLGLICNNPKLQIRKVNCISDYVLEQSLAHIGGLYF
jgi:hypothetical protein